MESAATDRPEQSALIKLLQAHWPLSPREAEVLFWLSRGKTNAEIGRILDISDRTAETHACRIYPKLGVENRHAAIVEVFTLQHQVQPVGPPFAAARL